MASSRRPLGRRWRRWFLLGRGCLFVREGRSRGGRGGMHLLDVEGSNTVLDRGGHGVDHATRERRSPDALKMVVVSVRRGSRGQRGGRETVQRKADPTTVPGHSLTCSTSQPSSQHRAAGWLVGLTLTGSVIRRQDPRPFFQPVPSRHTATVPDASSLFQPSVPRPATGTQPAPPTPV